MIKEFIAQNKIIYLDGGASTTLQDAGYNINDEMWSATLLTSSPEGVQKMHEDFYAAGADVCISISYQATVEGFMKKGFSQAEAEKYLQDSVKLALAARDAFWAKEENRVNRARPLVAASVGPYGAYLADGSEYTGNYGLTREELRAFHAQRMQLLIDAGADILACETIPSFEEALVLAQLAQENGAECWVSFSCRDGAHISDGTPIEECVRALEEYTQVAAVGVNCIPPQIGEELVGRINAVTEKPIVIYANSGEEYDAQNKVWLGATDGLTYADRTQKWYDAGARIIGGCCRTGPQHICHVHSKLAFAREEK